MIAPKATGNWRTGPFIFATSDGFSDGSLPAKSTVAVCELAMPAPEPTGLKFTVRPWPFSVEPHCW